MRSWLLVVFGILLSILIVAAIIYSQNPPTPAPQMGQTSNEHLPQAGSSPLGQVKVEPSSSPTALPSLSPSSKESPFSSQANPDLSVDSNGLSKATVVMKTTEGIIKFKFYPIDAPKTVNRLIELIQQGFYNGLSFHRVVPGFVIQGGDPLGNGTGGSGQKLEAEFNKRRHVEGSVAMARAADPNSADSQFYISLGTHPHLDHNYTVFAQVIEGMDVAKKIKAGDKMMTLKIE